jgi:hypothetical protein
VLPRSNRKNLGYLFAVQHGAKVIYDVDDDNELFVPMKDLAVLLDVSATTETRVVPRVVQHTSSEWHHLFNPYPEYAAAGGETLWPRGFPLDAIRDNRTYGLPLVPWVADRDRSAQIGFLQLLADVDPDVDAIFRMTHGVPVSFGKRSGVTVVPRGAMAPCNGQAMVAYAPSFWALALPITVHGGWVGWVCTAGMLGALARFMALASVVTGTALIPTLTLQDECLIYGARTLRSE